MGLKPEQKVILTGGEPAIVKKELSRSRQTAVYLVDVNGRQMALKWYQGPLGDSIYSNLEKNMLLGIAQSSAFIWPDYLTVKSSEGYGYVMRLPPDGYYELGDFLLGRVAIGSYPVMLKAANRICEIFRLLHDHGLCIENFGDSSLLINPESGDVLVCGNDCLVPLGGNPDIKPIAPYRYMAPELLDGCAPGVNSDSFTLSVLLFMVFFANHPFAGKKAAECAFINDEDEKRIFGSEAVFIFDPEKPEENGPVNGIHQNVMSLWPKFPQALKDAFLQEFSQHKLKTPGERKTVDEWQNLVRQPNASKVMVINDSTDVVLTPGKEIFIEGSRNPDAGVELDKKGVMVIRNLSHARWSVITLRGDTRYVEHGDIMPAKLGLRITFRPGIEAEIKSN